MGGHGTLRPAKSPSPRFRQTAAHFARRATASGTAAVAVPHVVFLGARHRGLGCQSTIGAMPGATGLKKPAFFARGTRGFPSRGSSLEQGTAWHGIVTRATLSGLAYVVSKGVFAYTQASQLPCARPTARGRHPPCARFSRQPFEMPTLDSPSLPRTGWASIAIRHTSCPVKR